jgi:hypothetical protein
VTKVTDTVSVIESTGMAAMHVGRVVSLRFYTRSGIVRVTIPLARFCGAARGECDSNGRPWPMHVAESRAEAIQREMEADAAATSAGREMPSPLPNLGTGCEAAWQLLQSRPEIQVREAAEHCNVSPTTLNAWLGEFHPGELRRVRAAAGLNFMGRPRRPLPKPGGHLL